MKTATQNSASTWEPGQAVKVFDRALKTPRFRDGVIMWQLPLSRYGTTLTTPDYCVKIHGTSRRVSAQDIKGLNQ